MEMGKFRVFFVKSMYSHLGSNEVRVYYKYVWKAKIPLKIKNLDMAYIPQCHFKKGQLTQKKLVGRSEMSLL